MYEGVLVKWATWDTSKTDMWDSKALTCIHNDVDEVHALGEGIPQVDVMEGYDASLPLGSFQGLSSLQRLFSSHLVLVKLRKIVYDDGNGKRNNQDATNATDTSYHFTKRGCRVYVPIANCSHGDTSPPERLRNADELSVFLLFLSEVSETWEYENAHGKKKH